MAFAFGAVWHVAGSWTIDFAELEQYKSGIPSRIIDDAGNEIGRFQLDRRDPVALAQIHTSIIDAFIVTEDRPFFSHYGISVRGIGRSIMANITQRRIAQGASTITQQLVKLIFLDSQRTFKRKIKEFFIAHLIEYQFSKEQILETYLNHIYFGCGIYGVEAACQRFWNVPASDVTLAQAALLAGTVRSPERLCPLTNPEAAYKRRNVVLRLLYTTKKISLTAYEQARQEPLGLAPYQDDSAFGHIKEMVRTACESRIDKKKLYTGGLTIKTTINSTLQKKSAALLRTYAQQLSCDGGLILIEGHTAKIKALVGGCDFNTSQFNRVTQAKRQIASQIKPVIYAVALEKGALLTDICMDEPVEVPVNGQIWSPRNYNRMFAGPVTRAYALTRSLNTVAVNTIFQAGIDSVIERTRACGFTGTLPPYPSLALGCADGTLYDIVRMFNVFAHEGTVRDPYVIEWIKDDLGTKLYKQGTVQRPAIAWTYASQVGQALVAGMERSRKKLGHLLPPVPVMSKTGTTNDARTCLSSAATPDYTASAYLGYDDNCPMGEHVFASQTARPLVLEVLRACPIVHKNFTFDPTLHTVYVHEITGQPVSPDNPHALELLVPAATTQ